MAHSHTKRDRPSKAIGFERRAELTRRTAGAWFQPIHKPLGAFARDLFEHLLARFDVDLHTLARGDKRDCRSLSYHEYARSSTHLRMTVWRSVRRARMYPSCSNQRHSFTSSTTPTMRLIPFTYEATSARARAHNDIQEHSAAYNSIR